MTTKISKWGNSLGLRLPKLISDSLQLSDGSEVEIIVSEGDIIIRSAKPKWDIESIVENMTIEGVRDQIIPVVPTGKEQYWLDEE